MAWHFYHSPEEGKPWPEGRRARAWAPIEIEEKKTMIRNYLSLGDAAISVIPNGARYPVDDFDSSADITLVDNLDIGLCDDERWCHWVDL